MNSFQNIIKVFAVCLAVFIIVNIFGAILFGLGILTNVLSWEDRPSSSHTIQEIADKSYAESYKDVREIKIELVAARLTIKPGDELKIEINETDRNINSKITNDTLKIEENRPLKFWGNIGSGSVVLYIPENMDLRKLKLDTGAGKVNIDGITVGEVDINHGAGLLDITNSNFKETDIEGGAGRISIENSKLNNLSFKSGVGKIDIGAEVTGKSKIECGIGEMNIRLKGSQSDYRITVEKGIGSLRIDGEEASSNVTYGNGANTIKLNGGIGSINVRFEQ